MPLLIRPFRHGDEAALWSVFSSSIHGLTHAEYSAEQRQAWAPSQYDEALWTERMRGLHPFIAELDGMPVGYADLQADGYIDHFFVAGSHAGRGVGHALMAHIHTIARQRDLTELWARVSLTAEPFFRKQGFSVEERLSFLLRGVPMTHARMRKRLNPVPVTNLQQLLRSLEPELQEGVFVFTSVPLDTDLTGISAVATLREPEGLTLVLDEATARHRGWPVLFKAAWITLCVHSDLEAVGLTAAFSTALADAGLSCNVLAGAFHDHIFVSTEAAPQAMAVLRALQQRISAED